MRVLFLFFAIVGIVAIFSDDFRFINDAKTSTQNGIKRAGDAVDAVSDGTSKMWDKLVDDVVGDKKD
jgi:hypothetical protein